MRFPAWSEAAPCGARPDSVGAAAKGIALRALPATGLGRP